MHIAKEIKNGKTYYRYKYRDKQRRLICVPISEFSHLDNSNLDQMKAHLKYFEAKYDSQAKERESRESWHDKFYNFQALLEIYITAMKARAPRSWESKTAYFRFYVLPFFLNEKGAANLEEWKMYFGEFKKYLKKVKQVRSKKLLSLNSQNHCITELNNFLSVMSNDSPPKCTVQPKCTQFEDKANESLKSIEEVFEDIEIEAMFKFLSDENQIAADLFYVLVKTGMRISEALGIGPRNVIKDKVPHSQLNEMLKTLGFGAYSIHIYFDRQLDHSGIVAEDEIAKYAPLKSKGSIHERYTRYVPLFDKKCSEIISKRMTAIKKEFQEKKHGEDVDNYLLFGRQVSQSVLYNLMSKFYDFNDQYTRKTPHDCRHTASTRFAEKDITGALGKFILGQTEKTQQRYNHLSQQLARINTRKNHKVFDAF
jgi:integrase